MELN
ncbi:hypothetical protein CIB84_011786 [Bambusicola thoracicus]|jgi:FkbM family methyltransferase